MCTTSINVDDDGRDFEDDVDEYDLFDQLRKKKLKVVDSSENKTEVDKYFIEACENTDQHDFDVLKWWKKNASRFKVLSKIAQDVFAIPISTVASESAFSTGGRVIDPYRSNLSPKTVQALICTQNWIRQKISFDFDATFTNEEVEALEAGAIMNVPYMTILATLVTIPDSSDFINFKTSNLKVPIRAISLSIT
ncbi:hypothetical protein L6452_22665 [Arctium lappa]|uniref:Uncharacterized protein n=1 Tax=Arctium lappa TaxID=4217 RepID=A0ACB9AZK2_ARCLA|nr:hypothetical protein L6452_22665 [Arctium lappa]